MLNPKMPIAMLDHIGCDCGHENLFFNQRMLNDEIFFKTIEQYDDEDGSETFIYVIKYETDLKGNVIKAMQYMMDWYEGNRLFYGYQVIKELNELYLNSRKVHFMGYVEELSASKLIQDDFQVVIDDVQENLDEILYAIYGDLEEEEEEMHEIVKQAIKETDAELSNKTE
jgi:hypothetical protein